MVTSEFIALGALIYSILSSIGNFLYIRHVNEKREQKNKVLQNKQERLEANMFFDKIRNKKELLEDALGELVLSIIDEEKKKQFTKVLTKFTSLFNEIEAFAAIINDGTVKSDNYIKDIILPEIKKLAYIQIETFSTLNVYAATCKLPKLYRPDYCAFKEMDKFLKNNYGEDSTFWKDIVKKRKECGL